MPNDVRVEIEERHRVNTLHVFVNGARRGTIELLHEETGDVLAFLHGDPSDVRVKVIPHAVTEHQGDEDGTKGESHERPEPGRSTSV